MLYRAFVTLQSNKIQLLHDTLVNGMETKKLGLNAQEITTLWTTFADAKVDDPTALYLLSEETRRLRFDYTFNASMLIAIAKSIKRLNHADGRVIYQLIFWIQRRGESLKAAHLKDVCVLFADMNIDDQEAWKRLGVRAQKVSVELPLEDIRKIRTAFIRTKRMNDRIGGMLQLFL